MTVVMYALQQQGRQGRRIDTRGGVMKTQTPKTQPSELKNSDHGKTQTPKPQTPKIQTPRN